MATKNFYVHDGLKVKGNSLLNGSTFSDSASAKLHVKTAANGASANLSNVNGLIIENSGSSNSNYALKLATGAGNILNVTNAGRVGIGTINPNEELTVVGDISASGNIYGNIADLEFTDLTVTGDLSVAGDSTFAAVTASTICNTGDITVTGDVEADEFIGALRGAVSFTAKAGEALSKSDVVYISGISGTQTVVAKADADDTSKMPAFGVASETVSLNANVTIYTFGTLSNVDTSLYPEGTELFVSTTAGGVLSAAPTGESAQIQKIAKVTRQHGSSGSIKIMGAGRSNATPNLNEGRLFVGNSSNQAVADGTIHVDIANSRVGIGTTSPTRALTVGSTCCTTGNIINLTSSTSGYVQLAFGDSDDDNRSQILYDNNTDNLTFQTGGGTGFDNGRDRLVIDNTGNVGIGITNPGKTLHVYTSDDIISKFSSSDAGGRILINDSTTNAYINAASGVASIGQINGLNTSNVNILSSGFVGIGTTGPDIQLHVQSSSSTFAQVKVEAGADGHDSSVAYAQAGSIKGISGYDDSTNTVAIKYGTFGGSGIDIDSSGNVGIGHTDPTEKLFVKHGTVNSTIARFTGANLDRGLVIGTAASGVTNDSLIEYDAISTNSVGQHAFKTDGTERMRIDSSGNVGIGTTDPTSLLHIDTGANSAANFRLGANRTVANAAVGQLIGDWNGTIVAKIALKTGDDTTNKDDGEIAFEVAAAGTTAEAMRIQNNGNVGIGTTSPNERLTVSGNVSASGVVYADTFCANSGSCATIDFNDNLDVDGTIRASGDIQVGPSVTPDLILKSSGTGVDTNGKIYWKDCNGTVRASAGYETGSTEFIIDNSYSGGLCLKSNGTVGLTLNSSANVGIGIAAPEAPLHILGGFDANNPKSLVISGREHASAVYSGVQFERAGGGTFFGIGNDSRTDRDEIVIGGGFGSVTNASSIKMYTGELGCTVGTARMTITSAGYVGIGTTEPVSWAKLHVEGGIHATNIINTDDYFRVRSGGATCVVIDGNGDSYFNGGNVGIGTTSPNIASWSNALTIEGSNSTALELMKGSSLYAFMGIQGSGSGHALDIAAYQSQSIRFRVGSNAGTTAITITSAGELQATGNGVIKNQESGGNYSYLQQTSSDARLYVQYSQPLLFGTAATERMRIAADGEVTFSNDVTVCGTATFHGSLDLQDNDKLLLGSGNDLEIYHNGSDSYISDVGTGHLILATNSGFLVKSSTEKLIEGYPNGAVSLYYDNSKKLETTSAGVCITDDVQIAGNLIVHGTCSTLNTTVTATSAMCIHNAGTGPALQLNQTGSQPIVDLQDDGTSAFYIEDGGNVGIGTNDPAQKLHVCAVAAVCAQVQSSSNHAAVEIISPESTYSPYLRFKDNCGERYVAYSDTDHKLHFRPSGTSTAAEWITFSQNGGLGVGTSTPAARLEVKNTGASGGTFKFSDGSSRTLMDLGGGILSWNAGTVFGAGSWAGTADHEFRTLGTSRDAVYIGGPTSGSNHALYVDGMCSYFGGSVGIGTTTPERKLHVFKGESGGQTSNSDSSLVLENSSHTYLQFLTPSTVESGLLFGDGNNDVGALVYDHADDEMRFIVNAAVKAVIDSSGRVGIGTTDVRSKLFIAGGGIMLDYGNGGSTDGAALRINSNSNAAFIQSNAYYSTAVKHARAGASSKIDFRLDATRGGDITFSTAPSAAADANMSQTERMTIKQGGNVGIGTTDPGANLHIYGCGQQSLFLGSCNGARALLELDGAGNGDGAGGDYAYLAHNADGTFDIKNLQNNSIRLATGSSGTTRMTITSAGDVGIGDSSPVVGLSLYGDSNKSRIKLANTSGHQVNIGLWDNSNYRIEGDANRPILITSYDTDGGVRIGASGSADMTVVGGNVGIGTTDPTGNLTVMPPTGIANLDIYQTGSNVNCFDSKIRFQQSNGWQIEAKSYNANSNSGYDLGINYNRNQYAGDFYIANNGTKNLCLDSSGNLRVPNAQVLAVAGALSAPTFSFTNDSDTGISRPTTNAVNIVTAATERVRVDSAGDVGIGTTDPSQKLHVHNGRIAVTDGYNIGDTDANTGMFVSSDYFYVQTAGTTRMTVADNGKVGIGTASPATKLTVYNSSGNVLTLLGQSAANVFNVGATGVTQITGATGSTVLQVTNSGSGDYMAIGSCALLVKKDGDVGIGVSPSTRLHVSNPAVGQSGSAVTSITTTQATDLGVKLSFTGGANCDGNIIGGIALGNGGEEYAGIYAIDGGSSAATDLAFFVGDTNGINEAVHIDSGGTVQINSPASSGTRSLTVKLTDNTSGAAVFEQSSNEYLRINTTNGSEKIILGDNGTNPKINFNGEYDFPTADGSAGQVLSTDGNGTLSFSSAGSGTISGSGTDNYIPRFNGTTALENSSIYDNGNVGIGTTNPQSALHIYRTAPIISLTDCNSFSDANDRLIFRAGADQGLIQWYDNSANTTSHIAVFNSDGNVGINTSVPAFSSGGGGVEIERATATLRLQHPGSHASEIYQNTSALSIADLSSGTIRFLVSNTECARLNATGLGLGTTSPCHKLHVVGQSVFANNGSNINIKNTWSSGNHDINFIGGSTSGGSANNTAARIRSLATAPGGAAVGDLLFTVNCGDCFVDALYIEETGQAGFGTSTFGSNNVLTITNAGNGASYSAIALGTATTGTGNSEGYWIGMQENGCAYLWNYENQPILFGTNTTERMRITGGGNVGIGITNPTSKLYVNGGSKYLGGGDWTTIERVTSTEGNYALYVQSTGTNTDQAIARFLHSATAGSPNSGTEIAAIKRECSYFLSSVGIGTTDPGHQLHLYGADAEFEIQRTGTYADTINFGMPSGVPTIVGGTDLALGGNGTWCEAVRIKSTGKVGIGTTNPGKHLTVVGEAKIDTTANNAPALCVSRNAAVSSVSATGTVLDNTAVYINGNEDTGSDALRIGSMNNGTGDYFIDASNYNATAAYDIILQPFVGNVGIGTTNPGYKLDVAGDARINDSGAANGTASETMRVVNTAAGATSSYVYIGASSGTDWKLGKNVPGTLSRTNFDITTHAGVLGLTINTGGCVGVGTTDTTARLDVRGTATDGQELLRLQSSGNVTDGGYHWMTSEMATGQTTDANIIHLIGRAECSKNSGYFGFNYQADGSDCNFLTLGGYAANNLLNIQMGGNVGIGTTEPDRQLQVVSGGTNIGIGVKSSDAGSYIAFEDNSTTNNSTVYLGARGNNLEFNASCVGIGTTGAYGQLHLHSTASSVQRLIFSNNNPNLNPQQRIEFWESAATATASAANAAIEYDGSGTYESSNGTLLIKGFGATADLPIAGFNRNGNVYFGMSGDKQVGIGSTSPGAPLDIYSDASDAPLRVGSPGVWSGINFRDCQGSQNMFFRGSTCTWSFGGGGSSVTGKRIHADGGVTIGSNYDAQSMPTDGLLVEGNVGIGTTNNICNTLQVNGTARINGLIVGNSAATNTPSACLHIKSSGTAASLRIEDLDSTNQVYDFLVDQGVGFKLIDKGTGSSTNTRLAIDTFGNVGIGTTDPGALLEVFSTGTCATFTNIARFRSGPDENATGAEVFIGHQGNSRGLIIQGGRGGEGGIADDTAVAHFCLNRSGGAIPSTTQDHIMTLRQGGSVGIGTTCPGSNNTGKLFVGTPPTTGSSAIAQFGGFIRTNYILTHDSTYGIHPNTTCTGQLGYTAAVYKCAHICKIIAYGGVCPQDDGNRPLGGSNYRWSNVHAVCTTTGAVIESNLCTPGIDSCPQGSVVVWRDGKLQGTTQEYDYNVMGVTAPDTESPIVMGAEPILVTGDIQEGDPIVTSSKINHGMKGDRACDLHGKVIAQALENGSGESYMIQGMIRKF